MQSQSASPRVRQADDIFNPRFCHILFQPLIFSCIVVPSHSVVNSPVMDGIKVPTRMQRAEVWPVITLFEAVFRILSKGEDADVCRAHQVDPDDLEAVV